MIFKNNDYNGIYERRYATREQALENHNLLVDNLSYFGGYDKVK